MIRARTAGIAALLACVTPLAAATAAATVTRVQVSGGALLGVLSDGVAAYKGIPFAAAPVGPLRWRPPQPAKAWRGVRRALDFAPACMQDAPRSTASGSAAPISEDCLYLNVWTAAARASERRPVMVWIYGGGFMSGMTSTPTYDGSALARAGVVLVSLAYRVGAFGFLAHPQLSREGGGSSGNYGLQDMVAGLRWVQRNIARFGGDPRRVTIFGESAGGIAVSMLAAAPPAHGLFQRVICESGGSFSPARLDHEAGEMVWTLSDAEQRGQAFLERLGARDIDAARALPATRIQSAPLDTFHEGFWPVLDGRMLPGDQYVLYSQGRFNDTPVLVGFNSNEGGLFLRPGLVGPLDEQQVRTGYGDRAELILAAYPHADRRQAERAGADLFRDISFGWQTWAWASLQSAHGRSKAFVYYFDHRTPQSPDGPLHAAELPYVFGTLGASSQRDTPERQPRPQDLRMSQLIMRYWVNFAARADPNGPGLPPWPAFDATQQAMVLDATPGARPLPNLQQLQAVDAYFRYRRLQHAGR